MSALPSSSHVAIDMQPLRQPLVSYNRTRSQQSAASDLAESVAVNTHDVGRSRSRTRSRSRSNTTTSGGDHRRQPSPHDNHQQRPKREVKLAETDAEPLLVNGDGGDVEIIPRTRPPTIHPETEDDDDDDDDTKQQHHPNTPQAHPGVDEGFFPNTASEDDGGSVPPSTNHGSADDDSFDGPRLKPRMGGDSDGDAERGVVRPVSPFPRSPGLDGTTIIVPDVNVYQQKKTLAQGMMDLALLSANANQLRYVLESYNNHPYFYPSVVFIAMSIILQISVGVGLILNSRYNVKDEAEICKADRINNYTVIGIFLITTVNVFITSFGVASRETIVAVPAPRS